MYYDCLKWTNESLVHGSDRLRTSTFFSGKSFYYNLAFNIRFNFVAGI